jgi:hypothetical protein
MAQAQTLLNHMILDGTLSPSSDGKMVPTNGDTVLVVNPATGKIEASGQYNDGAYLLIVGDKPASFNGTQLVVRLKHLTTTYKLQRGDGADAVVVFNGSFLPVRTTLNLFASSTVVSTDSTGGTGTGTGTGGTGTGTGTPPPTAAAGDLNGDLKLDEKDIAILKQALSGQIAINKAKMDFNSDGVVNTRDLIEMIRAVRGSGRPTVVPVTAAVRR